jgi:hypothetical protein
MFDFPQPFGPTIAVTPGGSSSTVRSMNDLKPFSSICLIRIRSPLQRTRGARQFAWPTSKATCPMPLRYGVHAS